MDDFKSLNKGSSESLLSSAAILMGIKPLGRRALRVKLYIPAF